MFWRTSRFGEAYRIKRQERRANGGIIYALTSQIGRDAGLVIAFRVDPKRLVHAELAQDRDHHAMGRC